MEGLNIYAQSVIAGYYEEFDTGEVFTDEIVNIASSIPVAGKFVKSIYDIGTQTEVIGAVSSGLDGIKSTDLGEFSNVSKKTESKIDAGIGIINRGIGIYTKYKAVEVNNEQVADKQNAVDEMANNFEDMMNRGLTYNTMTIKYDHCEYVEDGTGIKVDGSKNCDIVSNVDISISDIEPDIRTLEKQYNYHRGTKISKEDEYHSKNEDGQIVINEIGLAELEKQMTNYIETGSVEENSILAYYLKEIIE